MNIGILAFETVYSAVSRGGNTEIRRRCAELQRRGHTLTIRSFTLPDDLTTRPDLESNLVRTRSVRDALSSVPYPVNNRRAGPDTIREVYAGADAVIVEGLQSSRDVLGLPPEWRAKTIVRVHNVESSYHRQMARAAGPLGRAAHLVTAAQYAAYERRAAAALPVFAHISVDEQREQAARHPDSRQEFWPPLAAPLVDLPAASAGPFGGVLLLGDLTIAGNRAGAEWFAASVWPALHAVDPLLTLHIVGRGSEGMQGHRIVGHGYVDDLRAFLERAPLLSVLPVAYGGGVKIKTIDTLASALPAVYSSTALEGLVRNRAPAFGTFRTLDREGAFRACREALDDPAVAWARAAHGAAYAGAHYGEAAQTVALTTLGLIG